MPERLLRRPEVLRRLGIVTSTLYAWMDPNDRKYKPDFPKPKVLATNTLGIATVIAWRESDLDAWIESLATTNKGAA